MKNLAIVLSLFLLQACSTLNTTKGVDVKNTTIQSAVVCEGNADLPVELKGKFVEVTDDALLAKALGEPDKGGLCVAKVYQSTEKVALYRAWNSTNTNSELGQWWAAEVPKGKVSEYRSDYEICYQWSPLDVMSSCTLDEGVKVVIGTGQSAKCSDYLSYGVSSKKQVFVVNAKDAILACETFDGEFSWKSRITK